MRTIKAVLVGVLAIGLAATPALAKKGKGKPAVPACVKDKVLTSLQMRMLQTELVVGALSCQMTPRYNEFVTSYKPDLMAAHRTMLRFFGRESKMEDYKSKTANEASQRSLRNIGEFCNYTSALYDKLLQPQKVQLAAFVSTEPAAGRHGFDVCGSPSLITASGGKRVPMPRVKLFHALVAAFVNSCRWWRGGCDLPRCDRASAPAAWSHPCRQR
jgi:hypothetical protein